MRQTISGSFFVALMVGGLTFGSVLAAEEETGGSDESSDEESPDAEGPNSSDDESASAEQSPAETRRKARLARQMARRQGRSYKPEWASHGFSLNGLYPLWEATGDVLEQGEGFVGTSHVQFGLGRRFQLGVRPIPFFYAAPNLHFRLGLLQRQKAQLALQVEALVLLSGSARSFISSSYQSRIDNWAHEFLVLPISVAATFEPAPWVNIHPTLTFMGTFDLREVQARGTLGAFVLTEFRVAKRHGLRIHVGEVGFWDHDIFVIGVSYRLNYRALDLQVGYAYRRSVDGGQGAPLVSLGFRL